MLIPLATQDIERAGSLETAERLVPTALDIKSIVRRYTNGRGLGPVSLKIRWGQVCSVIGPNGSGKTTLIRCVGLFEPLHSGSITLDEREWASSHAIQNAEPACNRLGSVLGLVFQNAEPLPHLRVLDNIILPLTQARRLPRAEAKERAEQALEQFGLEDRARSMPYQLSGGLRQRVVLARAFALRPRALLLDEVTSAQDPDWTHRVREIIREFANNGGAVISTSHRFNLVRRLSDWVAYMSNGEVVEQGRPEDVMESPQTEGLRMFLENA